MRNILDTIETSLKMNIPTGAGLIAQSTDWEPVFKAVCLGISTTVTVVWFLLNVQKMKRDEKKND